MAGNKIADFFAEIGIKVDAKKLEQLDKKLDGLERSLHNFEVSAKKMSKGVAEGFNVLSNSARKAAKEEKTLSSEIQKVNTNLAKRLRLQRISERSKSLPYLPRKGIGNNPSRVGGDLSHLIPKKESNAAYRRKQQDFYNSLFKAGNVVGNNTKAWQDRFRTSVAGLSGTTTSNAEYKRKQGMYDALFGSTAKAEAAAAKLRAEMDKLHGKALREDYRRTKAIERQADIRKNRAERNRLFEERTIAIREAGEKRIAAIREAGERRAAAIAEAARIRASHSSGGAGVGRPRGILGGAAFGGALGSATSGIAGFLPGFGAAYTLMHANRINQELQGQRLAMTAVMAGTDRSLNAEQAAALGNEKQQWLKNLANTIGFDYRQTQPAFTKMLASGTSAGMSVDSVQNIFQGVSEYGRVMGLDNESMKGSMRAIEQMMN